MDCPDGAQEKPIGSLYVILSESGFFKVGKSADPQRRLQQIRTSHPGRVLLLDSFPEEADSEREVHAALEPWLARGEWFRDTPLSRWMLEEVLAYWDMPWPWPAKTRDNADWFSEEELGRYLRGYKDHATGSWLGAANAVPAAFTAAKLAEIARLG